MALDTWLLFLLTSLGMSLSPGPNGLLALTHGAMHGSRKTLFTIAGGIVGFTTVIALCLFGIGALLKSSLVWLTVLKWTGGAYLIWLGIKLWRSPATTYEHASVIHDSHAWPLFREGWLTAATNPKGLLLFSALLPQFIDPHRSLPFQFVVIAGTYAFTEFATEFVLASAAQRVRPWLARAGRRFNQACGGIFVVIGAALPLKA